MLGFAGAAYAPSRPGFESLSWTQWFNTAAQANSAPSWSAGLTQNPGCAIAPWASSINGTIIAVDHNIAVDARHVTTGCAAVKLQGITLRLSGDLLLYADSIEALNGTKFESGDGASHRVELLVPGSTVGCETGAVKLNSNTTTDSLTELRIVTPGTLSVIGPSTLNATTDTGCLNATGAVTVSHG